ncbi:carbon storage regulator CsrA [Alteribacter natronophilus]|uniref:carbon storage regulator CsrA n=1 Tax=Alteribacter natronophilus TaxID=2583810 RepID=UPI00110EE2A3|nr:carbon storage regulator CsrA [Alteribacter natronophilus]TMW72376.1 carbon storage regulator CsrA [Alteribacter natronophilus]
MLVLSRKPGESIKIGDEIEVRIVETDGGQVKIGITAPADVEIHRKEVYEAIQAENRAASKAHSEDLINDLQAFVKRTK